MCSAWRAEQWRPGGERTADGDLVFDSTIEAGNGQGFERVGPGHFRFRARCGLEPYAWRCHLRIESPGDGREIILEVADFNHFGQEPWQEQATVVSRDGSHWADLDPARIEPVPWTPTGNAEQDGSFDDGWHPPYAVRYRLRLDTPILYLASPTPYTPRHSREHLEALSSRCRFFSVHEIGRPHHFANHGYPLSMTHIARGGGSESKIRVVVIAGEHPAESAGMYACEGLLEEILRTADLLADFSFWVIPIANVDGVALGTTYHNVNQQDPVAPGVNIARDWKSLSQPETRAIWELIRSVRPHCVVSLHNGRHRRQYEVCAPAQPHLAAVMRRLREHLPLPVQQWRPYDDPEALPPAALEAGVETAVCIETLLLQKLPHCETFVESYRRTGIHVLRALVAALRQVHGRPQMAALAEPLGTAALRLRAADFVAKLPALYYGPVEGSLPEHDVGDFEVNGLPLEAGHYDVWLRLTEGQDSLSLRGPREQWAVLRPREGWCLLPSRPIAARMLHFEFRQPRSTPPFDKVLISPEGMGLPAALESASPYERYVRDTLAGEKPQFRDWPAFHRRLMSGGFGPEDLRGMLTELTHWAARRQVVDEDSPYYGAVYSEEDKYDARDAAAAAACFAYAARREEGDWLRRAEAARSYCYQSQMSEPGNLARDGGFVHMVRGIWGVDFTRLTPPYPGIDGVDTCAIIHQLCGAIDRGLGATEQDLAAIRRAADWVLHSEALPGVFLHHEGATHDCQNSNALGLSALVRAYHTLAGFGEAPPQEWRAAAERGIEHYLSGQEAIGVWPYVFASVGRRGQAFHFDNIPDHGIGLYHLTRVCHLPPLRGYPGLHDALLRAARWYLGVTRREGDTINLEHDTRPDLGDDICFSGFTWCRFTAAATVLRIGLLTGEAEPWRHLCLRLMEHVRRRLWQREDPGRAPVIAHARPEAKLATWCQAVEWDGAILGEIIDDLITFSEGSGSPDNESET